MKDSLERLLGLAGTFKDNEKVDKPIQSIYRDIINYLTSRMYSLEGINKLKNRDFVDLEIDVYKKLKEIYKPSKLQKGLYDVGEVFRVTENHQYGGLDGYIRKYITDKGLGETKLKNMDSNEYRETRHKLYKNLKYVFTL